MDILTNQKLFILGNCRAFTPGDLFTPGVMCRLFFFWGDLNVGVSCRRGSAVHTNVSIKRLLFLANHV